MLIQITLSETISMHQREDWDIMEYKNIEFINYQKKSLKLHKNDIKTLKKVKKVLNTKTNNYAKTLIQ